MNNYIDIYGLIRPCIKCQCGETMEYIGYNDEPFDNYTHRCPKCNTYEYIEEVYYEALWDIINQVLV